MAVFISLLLLAGFTVIVLQYLERLMGADYRRGQRWFWKWYIKGVVAPMAIWVLYILGALPGVPSLFGRLGWKVVGKVVNASAVGLIIIASYWAAMTLALLVVAVAVRLPAVNGRRWLVLFLT